MRCSSPSCPPARTVHRGPRQVRKELFLGNDVSILARCLFLCCQLGVSEGLCVLCGIQTGCARLVFCFFKADDDRLLVDQQPADKHQEHHMFDRSVWYSRKNLSHFLRCDGAQCVPDFGKFSLWLANVRGASLVGQSCDHQHLCSTNLHTDHLHAVAPYHHRWKARENIDVLALASHASHFCCERSQR